MAASAAAPPSGGAASPARGPAPRARAPAPAASREAVRGAARGWHGGTRRGSAPAAAAGARRGPAGSDRRPHRVLQLRRQRGCLPRRAGLGAETGGVGVARPVSAISPCCFLRAVAGSLPGGVRAEGQPGDFGSGGGVHRSPRRAGGDGVPGEEGVPSRVPRPPQHLPRPDRCKWPPRRCTCGQQSQLSPSCIFLCALVKNPVPVSSAVGWFLRGLSLVECVVSVNDELTVETSFQTEFPTAPTSAAFLFLGTTAVLFALLSDLPCS